MLIKFFNVWFIYTQSCMCNSYEWFWENNFETMDRPEEFHGPHWWWQCSGRETHAWHPRVWPLKTRVCNNVTALRPETHQRKEQIGWHGGCYGWWTRSRWCRRRLYRDSPESLGSLTETCAQCYFTMWYTESPTSENPAFFANILWNVFLATN